MGQASVARCPWCGEDPLYRDYHDREWGVPLHDDRRLFEMLLLESFQAGLSWLTILRKRENFRAAFDGFDPVKVAAYGDGKIEALMSDAGIVRNRAKIKAVINNAGVFLELQKEFGSFERYLWAFVGHHPVQHAYSELAQIPAEDETSRAMSKDLKKRGMGFVGPTTMYALMQSVGMVNDHLTGCFRYGQLTGGHATAKG
ncbi:MAG: DNA-3-methyladenine glycosylase I [Desulfarculaceae bacterium]|nr:DNA-3-methyladenine glycosylase I [Desulfarculaceae bacterium]MCF8047130.1 DNA-3-methyladenine glycosylase I [Desulfarculaceae bacterium]MCF8063761.1 DNA-3-methyladenine glycosylase I [Desulfarculaceae bacterium]MCF8098278.1 DNA-3-methyladenine glycosylase I [Desulfarculaceae bacterium]MCF8120789.1 DNA-3-methyladenine glycosylase I [Desulfarculaceae bacterium]